MFIFDMFNSDELVCITDEYTLRNVCTLDFGCYFFHVKERA